MDMFLLNQIECGEKIENFLKFFPEHTIDILSHDNSIGPVMDILFTPEQVHKLSFLHFNKQLPIDKIEILSKNFQEQIDIEKIENDKIKIEFEEKLNKLTTEEEKRNFTFSQDEFYRRYQNLAEIEAYLENLRRTFPTMVDRDTIGPSLERRNIYVYRIHAPGAWNPNKPALFFNSLQHAREWVSPPTGIFSAERFIRDYTTNPQVKTLLDAINVYYLPIVNPDGYVFTQSNRMWRKNRRPNQGGSFGVDLNRNWRSGFGGPGSSNVPSSETYRGPSALSEPESRALSSYLTANANIKAGIDFHSYSQLNLRPWGKQNGGSPDEARLLAIGARMVDAIRSVNGVSYQNIRAHQLYLASGILCDEFYEHHKQMGYTIELRPANAGGGGFALPPAQILPTAQENWRAVLVLAEFTRTGQI